MFIIFIRSHVGRVAALVFLVNLLAAHEKGKNVTGEPNSISKISKENVSEPFVFEANRTDGSKNGSQVASMLISYEKNGNSSVNTKKIIDDLKINQTSNISLISDVTRRKHGSIVIHEIKPANGTTTSDSLSFRTSQPKTKSSRVKRTPIESRHVIKKRSINKNTQINIVHSRVSRHDTGNALHVMPTIRVNEKNGKPSLSFVHPLTEKQLNIVLDKSNLEYELPDTSQKFVVFVDNAHRTLLLFKSETSMNDSKLNLPYCLKNALFVMKRKETIGQDGCTVLEFKHPLSGKSINISTSKYNKYTFQKTGQRFVIYPDDEGNVLLILTTLIRPNCMKLKDDFENSDVENLIKITDAEEKIRKDGIRVIEFHHPVSGYKMQEPIGGLKEFVDKKTSQTYIKYVDPIGRTFLILKKPNGSVVINGKPKYDIQNAYYVMTTTEYVRSDREPMIKFIHPLTKIEIEIPKNGGTEYIMPNSSLKFVIYVDSRGRTLLILKQPMKKGSIVIGGNPKFNISIAIIVRDTKSMADDSGNRVIQFVHPLTNEIITVPCIGDKYVIPRTTEVYLIFVDERGKTLLIPKTSKRPNLPMQSKLPYLPNLPMRPQQSNLPNFSMRPKPRQRPYLPNIPMRTKLPFQPNIPNFSMRPKPPQRPYLPNTLMRPKLTQRPYLPNTSMQPELPYRPNLPNFSMRPKPPQRPNLPNLPMQLEPSHRPNLPNFSMRPKPPQRPNLRPEPSQRPNLPNLPMQLEPPRRPNSSNLPMRPPPPPRPNLPYLPMRPKPRRRPNLPNVLIRPEPLRQPKLQSRPNKPMQPEPAQQPKLPNLPMRPELPERPNQHDIYDIPNAIIIPKSKEHVGNDGKRIIVFIHPTTGKKIHLPENCCKKYINPNNSQHFIIYIDSTGRILLIPKPSQSKPDKPTTYPKKGTVIRYGIPIYNIVKAIYIRNSNENLGINDVPIIEFTHPKTGEKVQVPRDGSDVYILPRTSESFVIYIDEKGQTLMILKKTPEVTADVQQLPTVDEQPILGTRGPYDVIYVKHVKVIIKNVGNPIIEFVHPSTGETLQVPKNGGAEYTNPKTLQTFIIYGDPLGRVILIPKNLNTEQSDLVNRLPSTKLANSTSDVLMDDVPNVYFITDTQTKLGKNNRPVIEFIHPKTKKKMEVPEESGDDYPIPRTAKAWKIMKDRQGYVLIILNNRFNKPGLGAPLKKTYNIQDAIIIMKANEHCGNNKHFIEFIHPISGEKIHMSVNGKKVHKFWQTKQKFITHTDAQNRTSLILTKCTINIIGHSGDRGPIVTFKTDAAPKPNTRPTIFVDATQEKVQMNGVPVIEFTHPITDETINVPKYGRKIYQASKTSPKYIVVVDTDGRTLLIRQEPLGGGSLVINGFPYYDIKNAVIIKSTVEKVDRKNNPEIQFTHPITGEIIQVPKYEGDEYVTPYDQPGEKPTEMRKIYIIFVDAAGRTLLILKRPDIRGSLVINGVPAYSLKNAIFLVKSQEIIGADGKPMIDFDHPMTGERIRVPKNDGDEYVIPKISKAYIIYVDLQGRTLLIPKKKTVEGCVALKGFPHYNIPKALFVTKTQEIVGKDDDIYIRFVHPIYHKIMHVPAFKGDEFVNPTTLKVFIIFVDAEKHTLLIPKRKKLEISPVINEVVKDNIRNTSLIKNTVKKTGPYGMPIIEFIHPIEKETIQIPQKIGKVFIDKTTSKVYAIYVDQQERTYLIYIGPTSEIFPVVPQFPPNNVYPIPNISSKPHPNVPTTLPPMPRQPETPFKYPTSKPVRKHIPRTTPNPKTTRKPIPKTTSKHVPKTTSKPAPKKTSKPVPKTTRKPIPKTTSKTVPKTTSKPVPKTTPKPIPKTIPKPIPKTTPKPIPETTPKPIPETTPKPIPETTPKPIPETTPKPIPETTPKPIPKTTPKPIPKTTPKPIPKTTRKPIFIHIPKPTTKKKCMRKCKFLPKPILKPIRIPMTLKKKPCKRRPFFFPKRHSLFYRPPHFSRPRPLRRPILRTSSMMNNLWDLKKRKMWQMKKRLSGRHFGR